MESHEPFMLPYRSIAVYAYSEQVGENLQAGLRPLDKCFL